MEPREIAEFAKAHDLENLSSLTDLEVGEFLVSIVQDYERSYPIADFDKLISMGITFLNSGHGNADAIILSWLMDNPSACRLDIVSTLLGGLWNRGSHYESVNSEKVAMLIQIRESITVNELTEYNYVVTLSQIMNSNVEQSLRNRISSILEKIFQTHFEDPILDGLVKSVISHLLKL